MSRVPRRGCSIGCPYCLTDPKHPDNKGAIPTKAINGNPPHTDKAGFRKSYCEVGAHAIYPQHTTC